MRRRQVRKVSEASAHQVLRVARIDPARAKAGDVLRGAARRPDGRRGVVRRGGREHEVAETHPLDRHFQKGGPDVTELVDRLVGHGVAIRPDVTEGYGDG